jgi:hypothetical protein
MASKEKILLPATAGIVVAIFVFGLGALLPLGQPAVADHDDDSTETSNNETSDDATETSAAEFIMDNGTLDCTAIANELGGLAVPNGPVCDVVVVRETPQITGDNGLNLNQFTLMNSVLEFFVTDDNEVYVMGDFALLETEMNDVLTVVKDNDWTVTGIHNHMINEDPKTSFMHWEVQGDLATIIENANEAFEQTSIKG